MLVRSFVKKSLDNKKKIFLVLLTTSIVSGLLALVFRGESTVYRGEHLVELNPERSQTLNIHTAGMPVRVSVWNSDEIKVTAVAELPIIIRDKDPDGEFLDEITIAQDDSFAISLFTPELFRYHLNVYLPRAAVFDEINIVTVSGNVNVNSLSLKSDMVNITTKSGSVDVSRATCIYVINTLSGNVTMDFDFFDHLAIIDTVSGNVTVRVPDYIAGNLEGKLRANSQSGQIRIIEKDSSLPENFPII